MPRKNPAAVALAKRRAKKLTPARRSEIAAQAARAKWLGMSDEDRKKAVSAANSARRKSKQVSDL